MNFMALMFHYLMLNNVYIHIIALDHYFEIHGQHLFSRKVIVMLIVLL